MGSAQDSTLEAADAVETVDMAAVSSSLSPPADQEKVTQLLGLAKQSLKAYRLTSPRDNSALHYYKQVLQLDPDNEDAKGGVREIATRYAWLADQAMAKSQYTKARRFARLGLSINPSDRHLLTLQIRASQQISKSTTDNKKITDTPNIPESTSERVWRSIQEAFSKDPSANTQSQRSFQNK
jgi:tetratricopeptide (TPR) repeat protein